MRCLCVCRLVLVALASSLGARPRPAPTTLPLLPSPRPPFRHRRFRPRPLFSRFFSRFAQWLTCRLSCFACALLALGLRLPPFWLAAHNAVRRPHSRGQHRAACFRRLFIFSHTHTHTLSLSLPPPPVLQAYRVRARTVHSQGTSHSVIAPPRVRTALALTLLHSLSDQRREQGGRHLCHGLHRAPVAEKGTALAARQPPRCCRFPFHVLTLSSPRVQLQDKDPYAARFEKNLNTTFATLFKTPKDHHVSRGPCFKLPFPLRSFPF